VKRWFPVAVLAAFAQLGSALPASALQTSLERAMHRTTLANGLQVIVVENRATPIATALVAVHNGAFTQDSDEAGLAHLYEHLLFHSFHHSPSAFALEVTKLRGRYNGTTSEEVVYYYATVPSGNIEPAIALLADLLRKARFSNGDLNDERPVVLNELQRNESDPENELQRRVERMLWGAVSYRKDVGGDSASIQQISLDRLKERYTRYYVPNNAALIVTGDVAADRIFERAQHEFGEWATAPNPFADRPIPPIPARTNTAAVMVAKDMLDVTIVVALHGPSVGADPGATYAADVLFDVFNDPSAAFQRRLVDHGPFRSIAGNYLTLDHTGPIEIRGKTTPELAQQALVALISELDNLDLLSGMTDDDLAIAKKRRQVGTALSLEQAASLAPSLAFWWSATGIDYYLTYNDRMATQTPDSLRRFARTYVIAAPRVIGVLGAADIVGQLTDWLRRGAHPAPPPPPPPSAPPL